MLVRMLTDRAGPCGAQYEGEVHDLPDAEARALVRAGQAEPAEPRGPESAAVRPPHNAALPRPNTRKRG